MSKRNGEIDLLRFIFAMSIVFVHFTVFNGFDFFIHGYIGVEFFFLVSGYLMARSVANAHSMQPASSAEIANGTWKYIIRKISKFYPYYLMVVLLTVLKSVYFRVTTGQRLIGIVDELLRSIPTLSMTFMVLNYDTMTLYVGNTWYLSIMIVSMFVLYPFLLKDYNISTKLVFPVLSLFLLGYVYYQYAVITEWEEWSGFCYSGIFRGIAEIALGASLYPLSCWLSTHGAWLLYSKKPGYKLLITLVKILSYLVVLLFAAGLEREDFDLYALLFCAVGVVLSFTNAGYTIPDNRVTRNLGQISLPIFIFHGFIRWTIYGRVGSRPVSLAFVFAMIVITLLLSLALMLLTDFCMKHFRRFYEKASETA